MILDVLDIYENNNDIFNIKIKGLKWIAFKCGRKKQLETNRSF